MPILDTLEIEPNYHDGLGSLTHVFGDVYAAVYRGGVGLTRGQLVTFSVSATGEFGAVIGTYEFNAGNIYTPQIIPIGGTTFAIVYQDFNLPNNEGVVITTTINNDGTLGGAILDSLTFGNPPGTEEGNYPTISHCTGDIYAITYWDDDHDRWVCTVDIDALGNIGAAIIDELEIEPAYSGGWGRMVHVDGDIYALAYTRTNFLGTIATFTIDALGNIGAATINTYQFSPRASQYAITFFQVTGSVFGLVYNPIPPGVMPTGAVLTIDIDNAGNIGIAPIDTGVFETAVDHDDLGRFCGQLINNRYFLCYSEDDIGYVNRYLKETVIAITDTGIITVLVPEGWVWASEEPAVGLGLADFVHITGDIDMAMYRGVDSDGFVSTMTILLTPTVQTDPATEVS